LPIDSSGVFQKRDSSAILQSLIDALRTRFGGDIDVGPASPARKLLEAAVLLPMADEQNDMDDIYRQMHFPSATGQNLDDLLSPFGFTRIQDTRATGLVEVDLKSIPTTPNPFFPAGSLIFLNGSGGTYTQSFGMPNDCV